jgi:hypothetical protein
MLRMIVKPESAGAYIDFTPLNECPGDDVAYRRAIVDPGPGANDVPATSVDFDHCHRIVGIEILNASSFLGRRFRTDGDRAIFPIYLNVDYGRDCARIPLRERRVDLSFDPSRLSAVIDVRELPERTSRSVEAAPLTLHFNGEGKICAVSLKCASGMLPARFLRAGSKGE